MNAQQIAIDLIDPNPFQLREKKDNSGLNELAESIKHVGIIQHLLVTQVEGKYTLIAGHRRLQAAKLAKLTEVHV